MRHEIADALAEDFERREEIRKERHRKELAQWRARRRAEIADRYGDEAADYF